MPGALAMLFVAAALVAAAVAWALGVVSGLTGLRRLVAEAWRLVDEELTRRQDLIPRLLESVRQRCPELAARSDAVLALRERARRAEGPAERVDAEIALSQELVELLAAVGEQPELLAEPDVAALVQELRGAQDRIAAGRRHYNDAVRVLDTRLHGLAPRLLAPFLDVEGAVPFEAPRAAG